MQIKMYSTHTCPYCFMLKDCLKKNNVDYEEVKILGFDKPKFDNVLGLA